MLFSEFCNDCSLFFCEPNNWVRKKKGNNRCKIRKIACFGVCKQTNHTNRCTIRLLAFFGFAKRKVQIVAIFFLASFGLMPVDPEAGATSSKLTCQCITPLCNAMILKILRCVDWWLTHSCLLDVELLANKMPTKVCVSAQLWMRPHVVHHTS